jgi:hypothetical protein
VPAIRQPVARYSARPQKTHGITLALESASFDGGRDEETPVARAVRDRFVARRAAIGSRRRRGRLLLLRMCLLRRFLLLSALGGNHSREDVMSHVTMRRGVVGFIEHAFLVGLGFVLMVLGLGLGVTVIMLPVGVVIGLLGFAMFVGGLFVRFDQM